MPYRKIEPRGTPYALVCYGADGFERMDDADGMMSERVLADVKGTPVTDVFFFCHGWKGDVPAAVEQYDRWIGAVAARSLDLARMEAVVPRFRPMFVGLHWPSLPFGDEDLGGASFGHAGAAGPADPLAAWLGVLGDTPAVRGPLEVIVEAARRDMAAEEMPPAVAAAYLQLDAALGLGSGGPGAAPDADRAAFDPVASMEAAGAAGPSFGGSWMGGLLAPLRQLSFWTMKKRARAIGEGGMHAFLGRLLSATAARKGRVHLMGHSFGCVVVSSMLGGPVAASPLTRPVSSVTLVQGAFSLWSFARAIPYAGGGPGYFHQVLGDAKIRGPLVTTRSKHDTAVGVLYPLASRIHGAASFAAGQLPEYGAVGAYGLQGLSDTEREERPMLPADGEYGFSGGRVYNLDASRYIAQKEGISGAHSDIDGPEVAHMILEAALAAARLG